MIVVVNTEGEQMETNDTKCQMGTTQIFKMPALDTTSPHMMSPKTKALPTLAIVKGPQTGMVFDLSDRITTCLLYTSPSPRDAHESRMPSSA